MKVSLNLAQEYSNVDLKSIPRDELLQRIGAQLGAVEDVVDWAPKFEGAMIVRVVSCEKHPDADKLHICRIDDGGQNQAFDRGEDGLIQVVCGAPNVHADMYAVWLPPGATVPSTRDTDPFVLEARELRGVVSNGMLASAHELGISDDHTGIVEVTAQDAGREPVAGEPLTAYFGLDDFVIDCENKMFTHRPDCFGVLGVAREFAGITGQAFRSPEWYLTDPSFEQKETLSLEIINSAPELVPRFMAVAMSTVTVRPSPMWLQATLIRVGIKPINNVVDVTNYVMHLTGQPLHAFDYDKITERSNQPGIHPRMSHKGEKLTLLGQKEVELTGEEIVIATDKQAVALAGVMGGYDTEVDDDTKNIIIECATFDMYNIRRTSMRYGLFTDAVTRYNKGQSPLQNPKVLAFAMKLMAEVAGGEQASPVKESKPNAELKQVVAVSTGFINSRLGSQLSAEEMKQLLENVEMQVRIEGGELGVQPPFWRTDIELPEDVVEEVGRLYGYDKLPVSLPVRTAKPTPLNEMLEFKQQLRSRLAKAGANEVLTYSFVHGDVLKKSNIDPEKWTYHIRNAISPDLQYYRPSILPSLLAKVHPNIKAGAGTDANNFALFEIGRAHVKGHEEDGLPLQMERLALVFAADDKTASVRYEGAAYYQARRLLDEITNGQASFKPVENFEYPVTSAYAEGRSAEIQINGETLGVIGEIRRNTARGFKLPSFCAGFELDITLLKEYLKPSRYEPLPPFPSIALDYTHEVPTDSSWHDVAVMIAHAADEANDHGYKVSIEPRDIFQPENSDKKRLTFRIELHHPAKTLTTEEANTFVRDVAARLTHGS